MVHIDKEGELVEVGGDLLEIGADISVLIVTACESMRENGGDAEDVAVYIESILYSAMVSSWSGEVKEGITNGCEAVAKTEWSKTPFNLYFENGMEAIS